MQFDRIIATHLLQIKAIIINAKEAFTWASGLRSPIYCDNRLLLSYPYIRHDLIDAFCEAVQELPPFDTVAGVATAGIAHGALLADRLGLPFIYVRSSTKGHGRQNQIEGQVVQGANVLVIEDLISTGGSSLAACRALTDAEMKVSGLLSIFTYELQRAAENFADVGFDVKSVTTLSTLLQVAHEYHLIDDEALESIRSWRLDPSAWSESYSQSL